MDSLKDKYTKTISPLLIQSQNVLHVIIMTWQVTLIKSNILTFGAITSWTNEKNSLWLFPLGIDLKPKNKTIISPPFVIR